VARSTAEACFDNCMKHIQKRQLDFGIGIKNGFKEVVQRHKDRFEMTYGLTDSNFDFVLENERLLDIVHGILGSNDCVVINKSIVMSLPGSSDQSWHCDGPHLSVETHLPCHCLNVFIPLVDIDDINGPTEFRPGSQVYTRDLAKLFLLASLKKEIKAKQAPTMPCGSILMVSIRL
jgi:ectoine hydroxylase-related dioxygenase (phytanoyl-CoA dioxygenase family)